MSEFTRRELLELYAGLFEEVIGNGSDIEKDNYSDYRKVLRELNALTGCWKNRGCLRELDEMENEFTFE